MATAKGGTMAVTVLVAALVIMQATAMDRVNLSPARARSLSRSTPDTSLESFTKTGMTARDDPFEHVRSVIDHLDEDTDPKMPHLIPDEGLDQDTAFLEVATQAGRVRSYCEICILVMQMKERGQPHLCAGLNALHYVTCIENLESLLRADKAIVYWLKNGCMHMDSTGPEIVRPCPAIQICSWVPNLFAQPPSLIRDGVESICPKDPKFLPTIPNEYKTLLAPQNAATPGPQSG